MARRAVHSVMPGERDKLNDHAWAYGRNASGNEGWFPASFWHDQLPASPSICPCVRGARRATMSSLRFRRNLIHPKFRCSQIHRAVDDDDTSISAASWCKTKHVRPPQWRPLWKPTPRFPEARAHLASTSTSRTGSTRPVAAGDLGQNSLCVATIRSTPGDFFGNTDIFHRRTNGRLARRAVHLVTLN